MKKAVIIYLLLAGIVHNALLAQTSVNMGNQTSITGCDISIYDDGGATGTYGPSHNYTLTVMPSANQGRVSIEVLSLDIHANDTLFIYDGLTATGSPIAILNNSTFNTAIDNGTFMASQYNTSGALTLRFKASYFITWFGNNHGEGFRLHATCVAACSPFQLALDTAHCSHLPQLNPENGYYYLDLCPNDTVHLAVNGIYYNQAVAGYNQSDATTTFSWQLEPEVILSGIGMDSLTHVFTPGMGFEVSVTAQDTLTCPAQQPVTFRVRTSANPISSIPPLPAICEGETITPTIGYDATDNIILEEVGHSQYASLKVNDTVFLPDGISCPPYGIYYRSNVTFTEFAPGSTITNANDILYLRIKMEHSAIEDLKIDIYCPDGRSCNILPHPNFETNIWYVPQYFRVNMGSAYRPDVISCNASLNPMGEPWNYVWSNNSTLGYQYASSNGSCFNSSNFHSHYNPHWDNSNYDYFGDSYHSYSVDSSNLANMSQIYHPYQNFNSLVGCPLNGNWYIQVQDMVEKDNGYIVEWELALNQDLLPSVWEYSIDVDTFYFTGDQVLDGSTLQPQTTGNPNFGLTLVDDFGCQYDTTFQVTVQEWPEVDLGEDIYVCPDMNVYLHPTSTNSTYQYTWNTGSTDSGFYTSEPGTYSVTATAIVDGLTCSSSDTVELFNVVVSDTTLLRDTICQGYDYEKYGFSMSAEFLSQMFNIQPTWPMSWFDGTRTELDQHGCDSVVIVKLVVLRHWEKEQTVFSCEQYIWDGDTLKESGDYVKNFVSQYGCDSTVTLHLNIVQPSEYEIWKTSCGTYYWNNSALSESGDYTNTFTSTSNCDSIVTLHLTIVDTVLRSYNSNPDFCTTEETTLSVEGDFDSYIWNTGEVGPSINVTTSGFYSVTASNEVCERTAKFQIPYCMPHLYLPTAITPGKADGLNDYLSLSEYDKSQISEFNIDIYNRWGELVFTSNDKNFRWDGSRNGKYFIDTVYNYVLRYTDHHGKPYRILGNITVL